MLKTKLRKRPAIQSRRSRVEAVQSLRLSPLVRERVSFPNSAAAQTFMRVAHIITRLIIGGAQENTLHNVEDQHRLFGDEVSLITGPGLGPEGSLEGRA